ncbi:ABC transporter ATP-binding protein [Lichenifustis flavocetrariae]|uniref:ABC transporter ATP-binding protein n=1 Tax=Lichenifustis flavocetrariae TaxID=2949735 RepID=A0AA42CJQ8_9HYPH|nr:ABC transporter ATP-binding protein [Lichenifustis flavocetrariae]MCW6508356.1 ABC transporter ATP-binding protein [Lichenifustis flavocetrariae]
MFAQAPLKSGRGRWETVEVDAILLARGLSKSFRGIQAVDGVNLTVRRGTIHALIGPNGAGKTTCFNLLTKFLNPTKGVITFNGHDITRRSPADVARLGLVRSFQISAVFPQLTVLENVRVALQRKRRDNFAFWRSDRVLKKLDGRAGQLLEEVGLEGQSSHRAADLSYGRKRALELATTLALEPELLLLDEPMAGMAVEEIERTADLIKRSARNRTVLMVEHNLSVVAALSDEITVLARGHVLAEGSYATVSRDERVIASYIGSGHG